MIAVPLLGSQIELGLLPQRFQTSRQGLLLSWRAQLATGEGEPGDGLVRESEGEGGGAMGGGGVGGGGMARGGMDVRVQRRRTAAVGSRLGVSEADLGREGGGGGLLHGRGLAKWERGRRW